ncbi:MAG: hypothetical protein KAH23_00310, partial [Kiritimatiellae bacterium]|nr:hypothetical protein [Kiritimatiellia bacterium]
QGYTGSIAYNISTAVKLLEAGNRWTLYAGQITPEENAAALQEMYERTADAGYHKKLDLLRRRARNTERVVAAKVALRAVQGDVEEKLLNSKLVQLDQALQIVNHSYYVYQYRYDILKKNNNSESAE